MIFNDFYTIMGEFNIKFPIYCDFMVSFYYGTMASGKSMQLLAKAHDFQEHSIPFLVIKSEIDDRDGENKIYSRALGSRECVTISDTDNIFNLIVTFNEINLVKIKWVLVDESQFLTPEQVEQLCALSDIYDMNIICYGLKTDFKTHLFPGSKRLLELADEIHEIKSICYCGKKTMVNARINTNKEIVTEGSQIEIGGDDRYVALCRKCYFEKTHNKNYKFTVDDK